MFFFFFKQKTAYEMRISDWSSDVCSSDLMPIATTRFPSNWELSAARAASVVHLFMETGVEPTRVSVAGFGEYRPVADNDSAEGRNRNRRVVVEIGRASGRERGGQYV